METLLSLKEEYKRIAGAWDGGNAGLLEDRAHVANEIVQKIDELSDLLEEYKNI